MQRPIWLHSKLPPGFWKDTKNQRNFFHWLGKDCGFNNLEDWHKLTPDDIHSRGGNRLLHSVFNDSIVQAIETIYPEHKWIPWNFSQLPRKYWNDPSFRRRFFAWLGEELGYKELDGSYNIKRSDVLLHGGGSL